VTLSVNARLIPPLCGDSALLDLSIRLELELKSVPEAHLPTFRSEHQAWTLSKATLLAVLPSAKEDLSTSSLSMDFAVG
jgi:hypothetical protein